MNLLDTAPPLHMTCWVVTAATFAEAVTEFAARWPLYAAQCQTCYREGNRYSFEWNWKREFANGNA